MADSIDLKTAVCPGCRIVLDASIRLQSAGSKTVLRPYAALAVTRIGDVLVGAVQTGGHLYRFGSDGRFVGTFGASGSGRVALANITSIGIGPGDTVYVMDEIRRQMNRLTPSGRFVDKTLLPGGIHNWLPLGARRLFVSATIPTRGAVGYPFHILDTLGVVKSFGPEESVPGPSAAGRSIRYLALGQDGTIWTAQRLAYRIECWTVEGQRKSVRTRQLNWFVPYDAPPQIPPQLAPPTPRIIGLHEEAGKYLWIYFLVADRAWKAEPLVPSKVPGMPAAKSPVLNQFFDTIIEVIDIKQNVALASLRVDRMLTPAGRGYLASYEEDLTGYPMFTIWRPRLVSIPSYKPSQ
jgi:hypothetical protein